MMIFAKVALYSILGWLLAVGGIDVVDNTWNFLGVLTTVICIEALAYVDGRCGS